MSKFHSTVTRRDFMKGLGLVGAGLGGAATLTTPAFHDLDEVMMGQTNWGDYQVGDGYIPNLPWYVKHLDYYKPTVEIDWDHKWRVDGRNARIYTDKTSQWYFDTYGHERAVLYHDAMMKVDPTFDWKDPRRQAIDAACKGAPPGTIVNANTFLGYPATVTPELKNYPKFVGTPKENMNLLRGIVRFCGGDEIGVIEDGNELERITCVYDMDGAKIDRENVAKPYVETDAKGKITRKVIPTSYKWSYVKQQ